MRYPGLFVAMKPRELSITVNVNDDPAEGFSGLFQQGVLISYQTGMSVKEILTERLGLSIDYIREKVKTVFLDRSPVDDMEIAKPVDGSILALSGAMPGLVGAVMRAGSVLSPFRESITFRGAEGAEAGGDGMLTLKLFNVLLKDLPGRLLEEGVFVRGDILFAYFEGMDRQLVSRFRNISFNSTPAQDIYSALRDYFTENDTILLSVSREGR